MNTILKNPKKVVPICIAALFFFTIYTNSFPYIIKVIMYPMYREVLKEGLIGNSRDFNIVDTRDFIIYYKNPSQKYMDMIEKNATQSLRSILSDFDYVPKDKIYLIVYPEYNEMADKIGLGSGSTAMGVYYGGTISILDPEKWIDDCSVINEIFNREGPILHELTHYIVDYMSGGNVPVWFTEGIALYEEYRHNNIEWAADKAYTSYYGREELEKGFYELDEVKAYKQAFLIVKYICDIYGMESLKSIIKGLRSGKSIDQVVEKELYIGIEKLFYMSLGK